MSTEFELNNQKKDNKMISLIDESMFSTSQSIIKTGRFQKLSHFLNKIFAQSHLETIEEIKFSPEQLAQQNQAQQFLDNRMYESYSKMIGYGYQSTEKQKQTFVKHIRALLFSNNGEGRLELEKHLANGYRLEKNELFNYILTSPTGWDNANEIDYVLKNLYIQDKNRQHTFITTGVGEALKEIFAKQDFSADFMKFCVEKIKETLNGYSASDLNNIHQSLIILYGMDSERFLKDVSFDEMMKFVKLNHDCFNTIYDAYHHNSSCGYSSTIFDNWSKKEIPALIEQHYTTDLEQRLQQTKQTYKGELENMALRQARESLEHQSVKALPKEVKETINEIETIYWNLKNSHKKGENPQLDFDIENIFEKRIPEVLEKYIRIPEEYRQNTRHEITGKTAYEMMMESLGNYQQKLQDILAEKIQNNLSGMNATKIYSQKIR